MLFTEEFAHKVYDILISKAGAIEVERYSFVQAHTTDDDFLHGCPEWRFCGNLGFGGKYRARRNMVDCYTENLNDTTQKIIEDTNESLRKLALEYIDCIHIHGNNKSEFSELGCDKLIFSSCPYIENMIAKKNIPCFLYYTKKKIL